MDIDAPRIDLRLAGTAEVSWERVRADLPEFRWPACDRVLVVSPHPDDETLGSGGLITTGTLRGLPVVVISVSDGEAAGPEPGLAARRRGELDLALRCLADDAVPQVVRLALPDGAIEACIDQLTGHLEAAIVPSDLIVCPLPDDGHPDHDACGRAALAAAARRRAALRAVPIWAWHWHDPATTSIRRGARLALSPTVRARKRRAIAEFSSQTEGPDPVVPPFMLDRLDRADEVLVAPPWSR